MNESEKHTKMTVKNPFEGKNHVKSHVKNDVSETETKKTEPKNHPEKVAKKKEEPVKENEKEMNIESEEELLVENDGDFFWLLQKAVWTIAKIVFILGVVTLIIWSIWSDDGEPDPVQMPTSNELNVPTTTQVSEKPMPNIYQEGSNIRDALLAQPREEIVLRDDIGIYMNWVQRTKYFFETEMNLYQWGNNINIRAYRMDQFLNKIQTLVAESQNLRQALVFKINTYYTGIEQSNKMIAYETARLNESLQLVRPIEVEQHLYKKIAIQKQREQHTVFFDANKYVLQMMEVYDRSLRDIYQKALINKYAIIQNIQVVQFENDPFKRVLTPAEWKGQ